MRRVFLILMLMVSIGLSATQRVVSLQQDSTVMGGWTIAADDTVMLYLNGNTLAFNGSRDYTDFGLTVRGKLSVIGSGGDSITHRRPISRLVTIDGGELEIAGGIWNLSSSRLTIHSPLFVLQQGGLHIRSGVFYPVFEMVQGVRDTMSITGGEFHAGSGDSYFDLAATVHTSLRGGIFQTDPRLDGLDADYRYEVYAMSGVRPSYQNYRVGLAHTDTTRLSPAGYCWGDTLWFGGRPITAPGLYYDTLTNVRGGDSVLVLPVEWNCTKPTYVYHYENVVACDSLLWNDRWLYRSGLFYYDTISLPNWRDSVLVLNLQLGHTSLTEKTVRTCDSYDWRGRTLTESGEYYDSLQTVIGGCDSVFHLSLTIGRSTEMHRDTVHICSGHSYTWLGSTYTNAGVYSKILETDFPCDSVVELHLVIDAYEQDSVSAYSLHGHRMLVLDHAALEAQGYHFAIDSVVWYRVVGEVDDRRYGENLDDEKVGTGDFYSGDGNPLQGDYYALIHAENADECRLPLRTMVLHAPVAAAAPAVSLSPAMVTSGTPVCISGLDSDTNYTIRIMSPSGLLLRTASVHDAESYVFDAVGDTGCYFVSVLSDTENVSLRYIVQ